LAGGARFAFIGGMSMPRVSPVQQHDESDPAVEIARLRAQVRALADLLIECGIVDAAMVEGRLRAATARLPKPQPARGRVEPRGARVRRSFLSRLFRRDPTDPSISDAIVGAVPTTKLTDQTSRVINLPFDPSVLYAEPDLQTDRHTDRKRTNLTPTDVGKCERCWRMRALASSRLCFRCASQ
jgi:hypothetical protein